MTGRSRQSRRRRSFLTRTSFVLGDPRCGPAAGVGPSLHDLHFSSSPLRERRSRFDVTRATPRTLTSMAVLPRQLAPMLATASRELPGDQDAWTFELKWDGIRAVVFVEDGRVRVQTRSLRDVTVAWPELAGLAAVIERPTLLDGEIVAL